MEKRKKTLYKGHIEKRPVRRNPAPGIWNQKRTVDHRPRLCEKAAGQRRLGHVGKERRLETLKQRYIKVKTM